MHLQLSARHQFRDELKGIECDTLEGYNIRVVQVFQHNSFVEVLQNGLRDYGTSPTFSRSLVMDILSRLMRTFTLRVPS